jgi:CubicO group peptidase (beta-lactamase class C family)
MAGATRRPGAPMTTDSIFNIASMTKPMTTVGALMLYEQGRLLMDDPLSKYFPKFVEMRVRHGFARRLSLTVAPPEHG